MNARRGFTIVELLIVIAVIGILVTISVVGFGKFQATSRDAQRVSKVTVLVSGLEHYYNQNGEYPSCADLAGDPADVTRDRLPTTDPDALRAPTSTGQGTSFVCQDLNEASEDVFAFVGDGSSACETAGGYCLSWTIKYLDEANGTIASVTSQHHDDPDPDPAPEAPTAPAIAAAMSGTTARGTVSAAACSSGTYAQYRFMTRGRNTTASGTWSDWGGWSTTRTRDLVTTNQGYQYSFDAQARCHTDHADSSAVDANQADVVRPINQPTAPAIAAAMSGTTARGTVSAAACSSGTYAQYRFMTRGRNTTASGTWSDWGGWSTTRTRDLVTTNQGYQYSFDAQARCHTDHADSSAVDANQADVVRPINQPTAPTASISVSAASGLDDVTYTGSWTTTTCPAGSAAWYSYRWLTSWRMGSMVSPDTSTRTADFRWLTASYPYGPAGSEGPVWYYADMTTRAWQASTQSRSFTRLGEQGSRSGIESQSLCRTDFYQSAWSNISNSPRVTANINAPQSPTAPTSFARTISGDRTVFTTTWTAPECNGWTADYAYRFRWAGGGGYAATSFSAWSGVVKDSIGFFRSGREAWPSGPTYQLSLTAHCAGDYNETGWQGETTSPTLSIP